MATRFREAIVRLPLKHRRADLRTMNDNLQRVNVNNVNNVNVNNVNNVITSI